MFQVEQTYDLASLTALCRAVRKTVRRTARILRGVCWGIVAVGAALYVLALAVRAVGPGDQLSILMLAMLAVLSCLLLLEDRINGWIALRQLVPGTAHSVTVFTDGDYTVTTDTTETIYHYENITDLCEAEGYFFFFLGKRHGQIFDKRGFQVGGPDAFRAFLEQKTSLTFRKA